MSKEKLLSEIVLMRPICILSILIGHVFAVYSGAWDMPKDLINIPFYKYFNFIFIAGQLPDFVFISGYLFEYKHDVIYGKSFLSFFNNKIRRILFPCFVFGVIYQLLYYPYTDFSLIAVLNGAGHLWFLPMLFWNYILIYVFRLCVFDFKKTFLLVFIFMLIGGLVVRMHFPLGISNALFYFPFMLFGSLVYRIKGSLPMKKKLQYVFILLYLGFLVLHIKGEDDFIPQFAIKYIVGFLGVIFLWLTCLHYRGQFSKIWLQLNYKCYGMYLIH